MCLQMELLNERHIGPATFFQRVKLTLWTIIRHVVWIMIAKQTNDNVGTLFRVRALVSR